MLTLIHIVANCLSVYIDHVKPSICELLTYLVMFENMQMKRIFIFSVFINSFINFIRKRQNQYPTLPHQCSKTIEKREWFFQVLYSLKTNDSVDAIKIFWDFIVKINTKITS